MRKIRILLPGRPDEVTAYKKMLEGLGAVVTVVRKPAELPETAGSHDGLLIPGGEDIDPSRYGQENTGCRKIDPEMDELQFSALDLFVKAGRPVLGICNGMQMINIYFGGDLIQDIETRERHQAKEGKAVFHTAAAKPGSWIDSIYGKPEEKGDCDKPVYLVNSSHHQAVGRIPGCLEAVLWSGEDEVVEGIRHRILPVFGLQWHPERLDEQASKETGSVNGEKVYRFFLSVCAEEADHKEKAGGEIMMKTDNMRKSESAERIDREALVKAALGALHAAYVPYSGFHVGAAALFDSGKIYTGVNIENASYPAGICAERTAISTAVANGERKLMAIAIAGGMKGKVTDYCPPCGICRQVMREFADPADLRIILVKSESEYIEKTLEELLPLSFGPDALA